MKQIEMSEEAAFTKPDEAALVAQLCEIYGADENSARRMLRGENAVYEAALLAICELMRMAAESGEEFDIKGYIEDERFCELLTQMPCREAVERIELARHENEVLAGMRSIAENASLPSQIAARLPARGERNYMSMSSADFRRLSEQLRAAHGRGRRITL